jgi:hypothetical protein
LIKFTSASSIGDTTVPVVEDVSNDSIVIGASGGTSPSAVLELIATDKGFLFPRMTRAQRVAISSPAVGLMVYQTDSSSGDTEGVYIYKSFGWTQMI